VVVGGDVGDVCGLGGWGGAEAGGGKEGRKEWVGGWGRKGGCGDAGGSGS